MKKFIAILLSALACCFAIISFTACDINQISGCNGSNSSESSTPKSSKAPADAFGQFGYNGIYLHSRAKEDISYLAAKELVSSNNSYSANGTHGISLYTAQPTSSEVSMIMSIYSGCTVITRYYKEGTTEQDSIRNDVSGLNLENALKNNSFNTYAQIVVNLLLASPTVLDTLEQENTDFKNMPGAERYPFKNCNTFHKDANGCLVIQTHAFAELASSVTGGINVNYRQDSEMTYNANNVITHWQSSLGIIMATDKGSVYQGYILEVDFVWTEKI